MTAEVELEQLFNGGNAVDDERRRQEQYLMLQETMQVRPYFLWACACLFWVDHASGVLQFEAEAIDEAVGGRRPLAALEAQAISIGPPSSCLR
jgi:hypothetical protein